MADNMLKTNKRPPMVRPSTRQIYQCHGRCQCVGKAQISVTALMVKAVVDALKEFPLLTIPLLPQRRFESRNIIISPWPLTRIKVSSHR